MTLSEEPITAEVVGPYKIVAATGFGMFLSALDGSIVNVSLVTIAGNLGVNMGYIQWIVIAYLLIITSFMPLMGKLGDRFGKTKIFQLGMILFITGSFFCAMSRSLELLVSSRIFQAIGASMMSANGLALVTYFTTSENRGRAMGFSSVILAAALGLGPVLGGILSEFFGWPSIFLVNLPIGVIGFIVVLKIVPRTDPVKETKFDTIGAALFFVLLFSLVYYFTILETISMLVSILFIELIFGSFLALILRESSFTSPIIPTGVMADRRISTSIFSAIFAYMSYIPVSFLIAFYLQEALGYSQSLTGLFLITHPITITIVGPISGFLSERIKARTQTIIGIFIEGVGLFFLGSAVPNIPLMVVGVALTGTGLSLFTVANGNFIMTSAPKQYMGVVSALTNIARTTGFSIAIAMITAIFTGFFVIFNPGGFVTGPEYVSGYTVAVQLTIWVFASLTLLAALISSFRGLSPAEAIKYGKIEGEVPTIDEQAEKLVAWMCPECGSQITLKGTEQLQAGKSIECTFCGVVISG